MGNLLKALAKVGLVELDGRGTQAPSPAHADDIAQAPTAEPVTAGVTMVPETTNDRAAPPPSTVDEGQTFDTIYETAGVPPSPFPVEKLLRLLDGLAAMEPAVRRTAVDAMDAADDAWTLADAVLDAQRKMQALAHAQAALATGQQSAQDAALRELAALADYEEQATASIRKQIAELDAVLEQEVRRVAEQKAAIESRLAAREQACARERARLALEHERLASVPRDFGLALPRAT